VVEETGSGPVVIQAHGMTSSRDNDQAMGFDFAALAATHRLVRYDARGHGESTGRAVPEDYTWPNLAADLLALIAEVAGGKPVDVIGASMGVGTALHAVLREPTALRRLVLVVPPTAWETRAAQAAAYRAGADLVAGQGLAAFVSLAARLPVPPAVGGLTTVPQVSEALLPAVMRGAALTDLPAPTALASVTQPTLILPWAADPGHPESTAELLGTLLPNATVRPPARTPDDLAAWTPVVEEFLR
jgi:3-oxoadipate enol-lactonase